MDKRRQYGNNTWISTIVCDITGFVFGVTIDNSGTIYFTNFGPCIFQVDKDDKRPTLVATVEGAGMSKFRGIVWNGNNTLYMCDWNRNRIYSYSIDTGNISIVAGTGIQGHKDGKLKKCELNSPRGIALDRNGDLFITEKHCVRKINLVERTMTTIAGSQKKGHRDGTAKEALFHNPDGIAIHGDIIYVADWENRCIRKIQDGTVSTIAGTPFQLCPFDHPKALAVDIDGNVIVVDSTELKRVDVNKKTVSTIHGLPQEEFFSSVAVSAKFGLFVGGDGFIMKLVNPWRSRRWVWIGHLKENPTDCLLATLPKDIIKEIVTYL